jgi:5-methyltetrahydrofolate--homocysteine methyltransferase
MTEYQIAFDDERWQKVEDTWEAYWAHELERPILWLETVDKAKAAELPQMPEFTSNLPNDVPAEEMVSRAEAQLSAKQFHGDTFPKWWINYGAGIIAGFLGCIVDIAPETDTVWFSPPGGEIPDIETLSFRYDKDNIWWKRIQDLTKTAAERWKKDIQVSYTDIGGGMDILASFLTSEEMLVECVDSPEHIERLVQELTGLWIRYYDELDALIRPHARGVTPWAPIFSHERTYMLQCDFSYMISPEMFNRFGLPEMVTCSAALDHGYYHMDGPGELPHLDKLLEVPTIKGVQWQPGDGQPMADQWPEVLNKILDAGKLVQTFADAESAMNIVKNYNGGKDFVVMLLHHDMNAEEAQAFTREFYAEAERNRKKLH